MIYMQYQGEVDHDGRKQDAWNVFLDMVHKMNEEEKKLMGNHPDFSRFRPAQSFEDWDGKYVGFDRMTGETFDL